MASAVIHLAVANEINKKLNKDKSKILIGSIAPDIAKLVGEKKYKSHFITTNDDIPNIDLFLDKYKNNLNDDFVLGYFIHLYTDYLWFKHFMPEFVFEGKIKKLNGEVVKCNGNMMVQYIYNDYTNLNIKIIDEYEMDLSIFYREIPKIENIITEIPLDNIKILIDKMGIIIEKSKETKSLTFDLDNIKTFVNTSTDLILAKIEEISS